jgi:hypothetical protein
MVDESCNLKSKELHCAAAENTAIYKWQMLENIVFGNMFEPEVSEVTA